MISRAMIRSVRVCLAAALLTGTGLSFAQQQPTCPSAPTHKPEVQPKAQPDNVETYLRRQMEKRGIPGLQVAVVQHGKIVLLGAYGIANVQDSIPVTNQTLFTINSATKSFVGVAIMQLAEDEKLDLGTPVSRYLDGLPAAWRGETIQKLLTHTSGLPNIMDGWGKLVVKGDADASWDKVQTMPMEFDPGQRFSYNQTNYLLLGRIIDKLSGQPFAQFITDRQLKAVGMPLTARAGFGDAHDVLPHSARGYTYFRNVGGKNVLTDKLGNVFEEFPAFLRTAAGMSSTAEEIAHWLIALQQQGKLLKGKTSLATLWTPGVLQDGSPGGFSRLLNGYALGWPAAVRPKHRAVGGIGGGRSAFFVYPDDDLAVVILTNLQGAEPEFFVDEVAGYYIPEMRSVNGFGLPPELKALRTELVKRGFDHAIEVANEQKTKDAKLLFAEEDLNNWAYKLVECGQAKNAVEIFKLNVSLYPDSWNAYDSLAECYEAAGDKASAIKNFKRSLELNPKNSNAVEHLKKLEPDGAKEQKQPPSSSEPLQAKVKQAEVIARLEERLPKLMKEGDVPGLAIALVRDGELVWHHGFGVKNSKTKEPVDDTTVFEAASLSKPVFAYAVLKLVDSGKYDLDKPLNQYLPGNYDVGEDARLSKITARHVLSHSTGFPNWRGDGKLKIHFTPGERFSYSGEGFVYLAKVIEHVTGEKFNDFMMHMAFEPLGMKSSSYIWQASYDETKIFRHNAGGEPTGQGKPLPEQMDSSNAAGSLQTTAQDYGRFIAAMLKGTGLKPETRKLMLTTQVPVREGGANSIDRPQAKPLPDVAWGLGWGLQTAKDGLSFWHWGDNGDSKAYILALDQPKLGVVFFANSANGLSIAREIAAEAVGCAPPGLDLFGYEQYNSPRRVLFKEILAQGATKALREYRAKSDGRPANEVLDEKQMNNLGYDLLGSKRVDDALEVLKLNVSLYPESWNAYDSLAECYEAAGDKASAIKNFKRSLELNPKNTNAVEHLKKLEPEGARHDGAKPELALDDAERS